METAIKVGISACLLGEKVRYDGGHKLDHFLKDTLGQFVEWIPVCPEVECGLPVPREAMRLTGDPDRPRLVTVRTGIDHTDRMKRWAEDRLIKLCQEDLCGFIFKSRSPSSGMRGVKVYGISGDVSGGAAGIPSRAGVGLFAEAFMKHFRMMPVEDEGRLNDPSLRENFIERIFIFKRWKSFLQYDGSLKGLVDFHADHKLSILSHSTRHYTDLGRLVAHAREYKTDILHEKYLVLLMEGLKLLATSRKNTNVLQHMMGYFKKQLTPPEKNELMEVIGDYHNGLLPLIVPIVLIRHYVQKYDEPYLKRQYYLHPHPTELSLRNHV
ncbi:MAG: DUF1722 domain-containing protein [Thermodesulfovibrio sp.]|nr:DUF1722 domain-containing protein [Thermodesulfovibrio sp.]